MRAFILLVGAIALAAYLAIADPFGTPEPERCPGGICPTPEHANAIGAAVPAQLGSPARDTVPTQLVSMSKPGPVLRAEPRAEQSHALPTGKDGWRIRLFYPRSAERIAHEILADINSHEGLSKFCNQFGFGSMATDSPRFGEWERLGYPADAISFVLVSPNNSSIYYVHRVPASPPKLLASLQEKMDGYYRPSNGWSEWSGGGGDRTSYGRIRRW